MPARTWIFQANPTIYDARRALFELRELHWSVKQHAAEIHSGDRAFIWESGPTGGLVAETEVVSEPGSHTESHAERQYYFTPPPSQPTISVRIRLVRSWDSPALELKDFKADPLLQQTKLCKMPQGTNFAVSETEALVIEQLLASQPTFREIVKRHFEERVVLTSSEKGALYCIESMDETGFLVRRLTANDPARVTFTLHDKRVAELKTSGSQIVKNFENTVAIRAGLLQSAELGLSADRTTVLLLTDEAVALDNFVKLLSALNVDRSSGIPKLYKPILLACAIEAIGAGEINDHRFRFDDLLPRFLAKAEALGIPAGAEQAAFAFFHLTNDLIWHLAYHDVEQRVETVTPAAIRERAQHAVLKEPYRWLLRKAVNRQRILEALAQAWWPDRTNTSQPLGIWWVNQGGSYEKERQLGTIWCPQVDKAGKPQHHWTNVSKVRKGDIIFHYVKGEIRSVSVATSDASEGSKPKDIAIGDEWKVPGWHADVEYFDLTTPLEPADFKYMLRRTGIPKGPFNSSGGIQMGYLFPLNVRAVCLLSERLAGENLPPPIATKLQALVKQQWDVFIEWGRRFLETGTIRESERSWKIATAEKAQPIRERLAQNDVEWFSEFKRIFNNDGATSFQAHDDLLKWADANQVDASQALRDLWNHASPPEQCIDHFWDRIPKDVVSGVGTQANLASFLIGERSPTELPLYRFDPFVLAGSLTGVWQKSHTAGEVYAQALAFLDRVRAEAAQRNVNLNDRIDAQTLVWCVVKHEPPAEWTEEERQALLAFREGNMPTPSLPPPAPAEDAIELLADKLLIDPQFIRETGQLLADKGQIIFYGPPGTGKTYIAKALAHHFSGQQEDGVEIVQFHPSYTYEDFVEGYRPVPGGGFQLVRGPLRRLARRAKKHPDRQFAMIIDEINRGNVAKVFGELYFLLEYRNEGIRLQYDHRTKFQLPPNLWIIATMNTADRSIALIDAALRRRFYFLPFFPDETPVNGLLARWLERHCPQMKSVADLVEKANKLLGDRHSAIGPSHFMRADLDDAWLALIWKHSVLPYLAEQFFGEEERVKEFHLEVLQQKIAGSPE